MSEERSILLYLLHKKSTKIIYLMYKQRLPRFSIITTVVTLGNRCELDFENLFRESLRGSVGTETQGSVRYSYCRYYEDNRR